MRVNQLVIERDAFTLQSLKYEVVDRPECVFWEGIRSQTILVTDHHKAEVEFFTDEGKVPEHTLYEFQFFESIYLFVFGFLYERSVTVDEKNLLRFHFYQSVYILSAKIRIFIFLIL